MTRLLATALIGGLLMAGGAGIAQPADGLIGHWGFDEGRGDLTGDSSGEANDADVWGAEWVKGDFGTALHFTGSDSYVSVPSAEGLDGSDELSVEAWVMWEGVGRYPNIISGGRWSPGGFLVFVVDDTCAFRMGNPERGASDPRGGWSEISAPLVNKIELGRWYHLAATFSRPTITTYVDGKQVGSAQWDYPVGFAGELLFGKWGGGESHEGLIDEVRIHNRALTADEVEGACLAEMPRRESPVAYEVIPVTDQRGPVVATVETEFVRLEIDDRARCVALIDKRDGVDRLGRPVPLASLRAGGKTLRRTKCTADGNDLRVEFGNSQAEVVIRLVPMDRYVVFEVVSVEGEELEELTFLTLQPESARFHNTMSGFAGDDDFGTCVRALNLQTNVTVRGNPLVIRAMAYEQHGFAGAKAALVAGPTDGLIGALQEMVNEQGTPVSDRGGPWAMESEATRGSYLFSYVSEDNVEAWIDLAKRGGFTTIHFSGWSQTLGHYEPRASVFPNGLAGMKEAVRKIHAAGLKAGMHTLTGCIATNDSWVTPVPHPDLAPDANYTLAEAMDAESKTILTEEQPGRHDVIWSYSGGGNVIRIGDELIHYAAISDQEPFGFTDCTRGAFGTTVSAHEAGAAADHLRQRYLAFYPEDGSELLGEVADAIAKVYNECEMDQIYMDGAEGMGTWHGVQTMRNAIYERLERPAIVEASEWGHWSWYYHSRVGAWDHPKWGLKQFADMHCGDIPTYRQGGLVQAQLGWWVINGPSGFSPAEKPDEIEYFAAKVLANDVPMSIQGIGAVGRPANARMSEYLTTVGQYERLRLARYFSPEMLDTVREPGDDFRLRQADDGEWEFVPTEYLEHKVTDRADGSDAWTVSNSHAEQPAKVRIEALWSAQDYDSDGAIVMSEFESVDELPVRANAGGVTQSIERVTDDVKAGGASLKFSATNANGERRGAWAKAGRKFLPHINLGQRDAMGVWIKGDGKGELLNIQLSCPREYSHAYAEHYVTIDFEGWRYVELLLRERSAAEYRDHVWPYFSQHGIFRNRLITDHVSEMTLYLNDLPANDTATILLSPIKAVRTQRVVLDKPTLTVNGEALTIPTRLGSGSYIELTDSGDCRVYDERCELVERVEIEDDLPSLRAGDNEIAFTCEGPDGLPARAAVTVVAEGPALRGKAPDGQIDWSHMAEELDLPRKIWALDGAQNEWDIISRSNGAQLGLELKVDAVGSRGDAYEDAGALAVESFDDVGFFADSAENEFAKYVHDAEQSGISNKPGVTQSMTASTDVVKVGRSSALYSATSTREDGGGWSARGRRFAELMDLSGYQGLGCWLHGDGKGESLKLQFRDDEGAWHDMVTRVNFTGWKYVEFDIANAKLDLSKIEYLIIYFNGIPGGQTVTCHVDDVRALPALEGVKRPALTIGGREIVFPVEMAAGDRLVLDGAGNCALHRGRGSETVVPEGKWPKLKAGPNAVKFALDPTSAERYQVTVSLAKTYGGRR